jgi:hypothetical protein
MNMIEYELSRLTMHNPMSTLARRCHASCDTVERQTNLCRTANVQMRYFGRHCSSSVVTVRQRHATRHTDPSRIIDQWFTASEREHDKQIAARFDRSVAFDISKTNNNNNNNNKAESQRNVRRENNMYKRRLIVPSK